MRPTFISSLSNVKIAHVACGSSHSVAWTASDLDSFLPSQSLNRWPHIKEMSYSLAVIDFSPITFQFNPDPLGSGDLLGKSIDDVIAILIITIHTRHRPEYISEERQMH